MTSRIPPTTRQRPRLAVRPWHQLTAPAVLDALDSTSEGLSPAEAQARLAALGPNALARRKERPAIWAFLDQFKSPLIAILLGAAVISFFVGKALDVWIILGIVTVNALLGFALEQRAAGAIAALQRMTSPRARVVRGGRTLELPAAEVVEGDVLLLEAGDRVAADARVLTASELAVSEAELTGESLPVRKTAEALPAGAEMPLGDRLNMVYMNTNVTQGRGRAVVVATGMATEIGRIARDVAEAEGGQTPVQRRLAEFGRRMGAAVLAIVSFVLIAGLLLGHPFLEMFYVALSLSVAAIPEGLPIVVSVLFAIGVSRMAKRRALIRRLPAVEGLGSATVIGSDKTGTLTRNEMTVQQVAMGHAAFAVSGEGYRPEGGLAQDGAPVAPESEGLGRLGLACRLCNDAVLEQLDGDWRVLGDPTEGALLVLAEKLGARADWERLQEVPFSSERKWMATLHRAPTGEQVAFAKGAVERLLPMATHRLDAEGRRTPLDDDARAQVLAQAEAMAEAALRVLAVGEVRQLSRADAFSGELLHGRLTLLGLVGMIDPARPEAIEAVATCQRAGIRVYMITGDHRTTAVAIARRLGLTGADRPGAVVEGVALEAMSDAALAGQLEEAVVFARVSPAHKLRLVEALQRKGQIVAMTGDGVNDAPALAKADIGVSMGITGTEVAKGASDVVLADDNFATIVAAVQEGRTIADNLRKVVRYLITTTVGSIGTIAVAIFAGLPLPLLPLMVLWINLVTDGVFDKTLALERSEPGLMRRPPRPPGAPLITRGAIARIAFLGGYMALGTLAAYTWELSQGASVERARTEAFITLAAFQWFSAFTYRSKTRSVFSLPPNWYMVGALGLALGLQLLAIYWRPLQIALGTVAVSAVEFTGAILVASTLLLVSEATKWWSRRRAR